MTTRAPIDVIISSSASVIYLLLLIACVTCSHLYRRASTIIAACYWLVALTSLVTSPAEGGGSPMAYYVIVTSYAMLPVNRRVYCVVLGVATGVAYILVVAVVTVMRSANQLAVQVKHVFASHFRLLSLDIT